MVYRYRAMQQEFSFISRSFTGESCTPLAVVER